MDRTLKEFNSMSPEVSLDLFCGKCSKFVPDGKNNHSYCGIDKYGVKAHDEACFYYDGDFDDLHKCKK